MLRPATMGELAASAGRMGSTKGWTEEVTYQVIAGGSAIVASSFDAHPNERMITVYYLDRDRLLLTHYCVAGNQPRLELTQFDPDRRIATGSEEQR